MAAVKQKVLRDIVTSPSALMAVVGGATSLLISWAAGSVPWLNVLGAIGVAGGLAVMVGRLWNFKELTNQEQSKQRAEQRRDRERQLNRLDGRLRRDTDSRTQRALQDLRDLYREYLEQIDNHNVQVTNEAIADRLDALFQACVAQLERSYELWETAKRLPSKQRRELMEKRESVIQDVLETIAHLRRNVGTLEHVQVDESHANLQELRDELDATLEVARRTEERMSALGKSAEYDEREFEQH